MRKPETRIYQYILNEINIKPEETVFLDDLGMNLKPARKLGINTIKVVKEIQKEGLAEIKVAIDGIGINAAKKWAILNKIKSTHEILSLVQFQRRIKFT